jgi:hypothetical protein
LFRKLVTYDDFNGEETTDELFFHLTKAEIIDLEVGTQKGEGSLTASLQRIIDTKNGEEMYRTFKHLLEISHGEKSDDGRHFVKNAQTRERFLSSGAYSALIEEMLENTDVAIEFVLNILPKGLQDEAQKLANAEGRKATEEREKFHGKPRLVTHQQLVETPSEEVPELSRQIATGEVEVVPNSAPEVSGSPSAE